VREQDGGELVAGCGTDHAVRVLDPGLVPDQRDDLPGAVDFQELAERARLARSERLGMADRFARALDHAFHAQGVRRRVTGAGKQRRSHLGQELIAGRFRRDGCRRAELRRDRQREQRADRCDCRHDRAPIRCPDAHDPSPAAGRLPH
jgi:hypothetical protein